MASILTSIKWWWRNHRWVDTRKFYVLPKEYEVFWLNEKQIKQAKKYKKEHKSRFYQYRFTPGPIGVCCNIWCKDCDPEDITDFDTW
jgi:hypothetical protein